MGGRIMRRVILESPYAGNVEEHVRYARDCVNDCLLRHEAALASHLLYTQEGILDDANPSERALWIAAGLAWLQAAEAMVVYADYGVSSGMKLAMAAAETAGVPIEVRTLKKCFVE